MTEPFIGIDFGTCNSSAAWFDPRTGQAEPLLNAEGENKTPSVVYFGPGETVVGRFAEERLLSPAGWKRVVSAVKRDLGKQRAWLFGDRHVEPLDAATLILEKIKRDAEKGHFHAPVARAVITCPAVFDEAEKDKLREAAARAGFQNVELLEEPVAAAVAYAEAGIKVGRYVLVYDLGGGTFDLALLTRDEDDDAFRLAMEPSGARIGGEDFDRAIYDHFDAGILKKTQQSICPDGVDLHLLRQCRNLKESLTASEQPFPLIWYVPTVGRVKLPLSRTKFERLVDKLVDRTVKLTQAIQQDAAARGWHLDSVILIGGSSRIPCIEQRLQETLRVEPRKWQKQDVAVALGAAYHAQRLWGERPSSRAQPPPSSTTSEQPEPSAEAQALFARARDRFDEAAKFKADERRRHLDAAVQHAQAASDLEPRWPDPCDLKGRILQEKGDWHLAVAAYTASLRLDPGAARAHESRGFCKFMAGDSGGARKDLDEAIKLLPTEFAYRYRAAANLRLRSPAAAVIDIQNGLALANQDTPRAALHAVSGLLMRDELELPRDSIGCFAEALRLLPPVQRSLERRQFLELSILFDLESRMLVQTALDPLSPARLSLVAWLEQERLLFSKASEAGGRRAALVEFFDRNVRQRVKGRSTADHPDSGRLNLVTRVQQGLLLFSKALPGGRTREALVEFFDRNFRQRSKGRPAADRTGAGRLNVFAWLQHELWQACKASHGGWTREAALEFFDRNRHETAPQLWQEDPELVLHLATIWAEKQDAGKTIDWLKKLLVVQPLFDIQRARRDPWIGSLLDPDLLDFLTPKWSFEEQHGRLHNSLAVTNRSPFRLTALRVRVHVTRRNGEKDEPITLPLDSLDSGAVERWPSVFVARGWLRRNITRVRVTLHCAEGKTKCVGGGLSVPDPEKGHTKTNPKDDILDVLVVDENPNDQKPNPKDDVLDALVVD